MVHAANPWGAGALQGVRLSYPGVRWHRHTLREQRWDCTALPYRPDGSCGLAFLGSTQDSQTAAEIQLQSQSERLWPVPQC